MRSVLALQLFVGPESLGSLNLYSDAPQAFGTDDRITALVLAAHIAIEMTSAQEHEHMGPRLSTVL